MRVVIRADGGPDIGFGHLVRTGALAERFVEEGHAVTYATKTPEAADLVRPAGTASVALDADDHVAAFLDWLGRDPPDAVVTDSYEIGTEGQRGIADHVSCSTVVLDDARYTVRADVLVNGNVHAPDLAYEWVGREPEWCLGTEFLLLRASIRALCHETPRLRKPPTRAIVTMGGSDIRNATPEVIRAFDGSDLRVEVVVGPGFRNRGDIERAVEGTEADLEVVEDPPDLAERMFRADLSVSATGSTVYELLALGTPVIGLPQADNQEPIAAALEERGALLSPPPGSLRDAIERLAHDADRRRRLVDRGRGLVDGRGVERVYDRIRGVCP